MRPQPEYNDDPDSTKRASGGPSWKWIAVTAVGILLAVLIAGVSLMANIANSHVTKEQAPGIVTETVKPLTEEVKAIGNRTTSLEAQYKSIEQQLAEIKALIREGKR